MSALSPAAGAPRTSLDPPPSPLWGCVVVAQIAAQAAIRLRPHLTRSPVVLMAGVRPLERICGLNPIARALGLNEGMTRVEVETFDHVTVLPHSAAEQLSAERVLLGALETFTPRMQPLAMQEKSPDWECCLDLSGTERLLGDEPTLGKKIVDALERLGFRATIVLASNVDAGFSLSRKLAWRPLTESAKLPPWAARQTLSPASAVQVIPWGDEAKSLSALPLAVLKLDLDTQERFAVWGIVTLGEIAALPEKALIVRMGQAGRQLRLRARGELPYLLEPVSEPFQLEEQMELDEPVETLEPLLFLLNPMLEQLLFRAQERALALAAVTISLAMEIPADRDLGEETPEQEEQRWHIRTVRPAIPVLDRRLLLKMLQLDLEAHPCPGAIVRLTLAAEPGRTSRIQLGLFSPQMPEPTRFEDIHARLVSLVGEGNVGRVKPLDTHAPEGFVLERFTLPEGGYKAPTPRSEGMRPMTALRRMRPPPEIRVELRGREIASFWLENRRYLALRSFGPWRASGDWWCGRVWSSDTWDVAAESASELLLCIVAHDLRTQRWVLEGIYD